MEPNIKELADKLVEAYEALSDFDEKDTSLVRGVVFRDLRNGIARLESCRERLTPEPEVEAVEVEVADMPTAEEVE